jgi:hypothetical protein
MLFSCFPLPSTVHSPSDVQQFSVLQPSCDKVNKILILMPSSRRREERKKKKCFRGSGPGRDRAQGWLAKKQPEKPRNPSLSTEILMRFFSSLHSLIIFTEQIKTESGCWIAPFHSHLEVYVFAKEDYPSASRQPGESLSVVRFGSQAIVTQRGLKSNNFICEKSDKSTTPLGCSIRNY